MGNRKLLLDVVEVAHERDTRRWLQIRPPSCTTAMDTALKQPCPIQDKEVPTEKNDQVERDPRVRLTDHAYG